MKLTTPKKRNLRSVIRDLGLFCPPLSLPLLLVPLLSPSARLENRRRKGIPEPIYPPHHFQQNRILFSIRLNQSAAINIKRSLYLFCSPRIIPQIMIKNREKGADFKLRPLSKEFSGFPEGPRSAFGRLSPY